MKKRLYEILESIRGKDDPMSVGVNMLLYAVIIINVTAVILETMESIAARYATAFQWIEIISVMIFTVEYLLRLWVCTANPRYPSAFTGRLNYVVSPMALVDLFAILPFYLPLFPGVDLRILRFLRLFRLTRIVKLARYSKAMKMIIDVLKDKKDELLVTLSLLGVVLIFSASVMYFAEHEAQPKAFSSIISSMWWGIITLTTIGYGDVYPVTSLGKIFGALIALLGVGMVALPTGIISAGLVDKIHTSKQKIKCPHCGWEIEK